MPAEIHLDDIGTALILAVVDEDGTAVDISSATRTVFLVKPDATLLTKTGVTDAAATNYMKYVTVADDLNLIGEWKIQGRVVLGGATWSTEVATFNVFPNLD